MRRLSISFITILAIVIGSIGLLIAQGELQSIDKPSSSTNKSLSIISSNDGSYSEITLVVELHSNEAFELTTSTSAAFSVEIIDYIYSEDDEYDHLEGMWSLESASLQVITTHQFPEGTSTFTLIASLIQNHPTFAPIDPPESLIIRVILGDNYLISSDYTLHLSE
ncbi:MAG: hypothetical protein ACXAC7_19560 [Candidatus Hodarchaeales archaeon]|jgi:hypothetical protein